MKIEWELMKSEWLNWNYNQKVRKNKKIHWIITTEISLEITLEIHCFIFGLRLLLFMNYYIFFMIFDGSWYHVMCYVIFIFEQNPSLFLLSSPQTVATFFRSLSFLIINYLLPYCILKYRSFNTLSHKHHTQYISRWI